MNPASYDDFVAGLVKSVGLDFSCPETEYRNLEELGFDSFAFLEAFSYMDSMGVNADEDLFHAITTVQEIYNAYLKAFIAQV